MALANGLARPQPAGSHNYAPARAACAPPGFEQVLVVFECE